MKRNRKVNPHTALVNNIVEYISYFKFNCWIQRTTGLKRHVKDKWGNEKEFWQKPARKGIADVIGWDPKGRFVGIEAKIGIDKLSKEQGDFLTSLYKSGGIAIVVYSLNELIDKLKKYGYSPIIERKGDDNAKTGRNNMQNF